MVRHVLELRVVGRPASWETIFLGFTSLVVAVEQATADNRHRYQRAVVLRITSWFNVDCLLNLRSR